MTEGLIFEAIRPDHAAALFRALDFDSVYRFVNTPRPQNVDEVRARITRFNKGPDPMLGQEWLNFVMRLGPEVIGHLQATIYGRSAEIGYVLNPRHSGHGYATTGTLWLIDHISNTHGITEFWASVDPANLKSINLLTRCGFVETSLPAEGLHSYEDGDTVFGLRRSG